MHCAFEVPSDRVPLEDADALQILVVFDPDEDPEVSVRTLIDGVPSRPWIATELIARGGIAP